MAGKKIYITTRSADETRVLGKKIGTLINQPVIISLIGDLASGKTAFVQGLAQGLGIPAGLAVRRLAIPTLSGDI